MFGPRTEARTALKDIRFPTTAPGAAAVVIDYDPVTWLRCPTAGQDRTEWHDRTLAAVAADLKLAQGTAPYVMYDAIFNRVADDQLSYTASFLSIGKAKDVPCVVSIRVADEELTLLETGDPEKYVAFADVADENAHPKLSGTAVRTGTLMFEDGTTLRAHREIATEPPLHMTLFTIARGPSERRLLAAATALAEAVRVESPDGRLL